MNNNNTFNTRNSYFFHGLLKNMTMIPVMVAAHCDLTYRWNFFIGFR